MEERAQTDEKPASTPNAQHPTPKMVIASHNRAKSREIITILQAGLSNLQPEISLLADFPNSPDPEEAGTTYAENALIKARSCARFTGCLSVADDAGLEIDYLAGQPGLHSKRFAGEETPFSVKMAAILEQLRAVPENQRTARFRCVVAVVLPGGEEYTFEDTCNGRIADSPRGFGGFGYDPIFYLPQFGCTMAELPAEFKNRISHRAKVLSQVIPTLRQIIGGNREWGVGKSVDGRMEGI